ncbi:hypothetical protein DFJ74DRAFT_703696 [Hyaloraphidium curvatum]|nr:hypothetical protein DFJ74DRAFT_703696 [Hyaloraphidium curvatum]
MASSQSSDLLQTLQRLAAEVFSRVAALLPVDTNVSLLILSAIVILVFALPGLSRGLSDAFGALAGFRIAAYLAAAYAYLSCGRGDLFGAPRELVSAGAAAVGVLAAVGHLGHLHDVGRAFSKALRSGSVFYLGALAAGAFAAARFGLLGFPDPREVGKLITGIPGASQPAGVLDSLVDRVLELWRGTGLSACRPAVSKLLERAIYYLSAAAFVSGLVARSAPRND